MEPRPGREEAPARLSACWGEERGERKLTVVSHCASQLAGINLRSTTALNLGCFCSRNHKRREN